MSMPATSRLGSTTCSCMFVENATPLVEPLAELAADLNFDSSGSYSKEWMQCLL